MWRDLVDQKRHTDVVEVGGRELRHHLSRYLDQVRDGREVTGADQERAVARLVPLEAPRPLDRLIAEGPVTPAPTTKQRPSPGQVRSQGTVSDPVAGQRR